MAHVGRCGQGLTGRRIPALLEFFRLVSLVPVFAFIATLIAQTLIPSNQIEP
jgi:hypothetical protein